MSYTIAKEFRFEAAHRLNGLPEGHQCGRVHGHSYRIEVQLTEAGQLLTAPGFVVDFGELSPFKTWIDSTLDHRNLNDVLPDEPTSENLARWLYEIFFQVMPERIASRLTAVRVSETGTSWAEYRP